MMTAIWLVDAGFALASYCPDKILGRFLWQWFVQNCCGNTLFILLLKEVVRLSLCARETWANSIERRKKKLTLVNQQKTCCACAGIYCFSNHSNILFHWNHISSYYVPPLPRNKSWEGGIYSNVIVHPYICLSVCNAAFTSWHIDNWVVWLYGTVVHLILWLLVSLSL